MFHTLADAEGLAIELDATEFAFRIGHDQRLERRHAGQRLQAESVRIGGYDAPCEHFEALFAHDVTIQEGDARGVMAFFRKLHTGGGTHEFVRHTHENACAVARVLLGAHGTTMVQIDQHLDGVIDDLAFRTLVEGGDHTHAASVMLGSRIVHTLGIMDRQI